MPSGVRTPASPITVGGQASISASGSELTGVTGGRRPRRRGHHRTICQSWRPGAGRAPLRPETSSWAAGGPWPPNATAGRPRQLRRAGEDGWRREAPGLRSRTLTVLAMGTISFDRAAGYHDATRGLPEPAEAALADVLAAELAGRGTCLEIGVGTGRIAIPLHKRGVRLVGMDVAPAMMARLEANSGGRRPFPLLLADATRLPFVAGSVGAVIASHVLHLVADWQTAVEEAMRVLRPEGALLVDFGGRPEMPWSAYTEQVMQRHGVFQRSSRRLEPRAGRRLPGGPPRPARCPLWA